MNNIHHCGFWLHKLHCTALDISQYKIKRDHSCQTIKEYDGGKTYTDIRKAKEECTKRNGCKGVANFECKNEKYRLCKSGPIKNKRKESGHCVYQKSEGKYI